MSVHPTAMLTILLMAVVTYALRAGGFWLMGRVTLSPRIEAALVYLPGAVIASLVVPNAVREGLPGVVALGAVALVTWKTRNLIAALVVGVVVVWAMRQLV